MFKLTLCCAFLLHCVILFINSCKDMDELSNLWCCYDFCVVFTLIKKDMSFEGNSQFYDICIGIKGGCLEYQ